MNINQSTHKTSDECYKKMREIQSEKPLQFIESGLQYAQPGTKPIDIFGMQNTTQYGPPPQDMNAESKLLNLDKPSDIVERKHAELQHIPLLTSPDTSSGPLLNDEMISSDLRFGKVPARVDTCNRGYEDYRPSEYLFFNPQTADNIIPEVADSMWITGGRSSRQDMYVLSKLKNE